MKVYPRLEKLSAGLILAAVYVYIFFGALSYQSTYVHYENINDFISAALKSGSTLTSAEDYANLLNVDAYETSQPRYTRPLSNLVLLLNHKIRSKMWAYLLPHPTLSPFLIFPLILTPLFLWLFLRQKKIPIWLSAIVVAYYLGSASSLSSFTETFRFGKTMVNFSFFFFWYLLGRLEKASTHQPLKMLVFHLLFFVSFFWDETFILVWASCLGLFGKFWWRHKTSLVLFLLWPFFYLLAIAWVLPQKAASLGFQSTSFFSYHVIQAYPEVIAGWLKALPVNASLVLKDLFGYESILFPAHLAGKIIFLFSRAGLVILFLLLLALRFGPFLYTWLAIGLTLILLHTALMISVQCPGFGIFYYGAYFHPLLVLFFAQLIQRQGKFGPFLMLALLLCIPANIYKFHYFNLTRKYASGVLPAEGITAVFLNSFNRYHIVVPNSAYIRDQTQRMWNEAKQGQWRPEYYSQENFEFRYIFLETNPEAYWWPSLSLMRQQGKLPSSK